MLNVPGHREDTLANRCHYFFDHQFLSCKFQFTTAIFKDQVPGQIVYFCILKGEGAVQYRLDGILAGKGTLIMYIQYSGSAQKLYGRTLSQCVYLLQVKCRLKVAN